MVRELRIGNYIQDKGGYFEPVISLQIIGVLVKINDDPYDGYYSPIPLTKEWLLKFGFKLVERRFYEMPNIYNFLLETTESNLGISYHVVTIRQESLTHKRYGFPHNIKSVHQLQNLYFALTGEELTIKE